MIIQQMNEIVDLHFKKITNENNYLENLCEAFINFVSILKSKQEMLAKMQAKESGKPVKYCRVEVERCVDQLNQAIAYIRYKCSFSSPSSIRNTKHLPVGIVLAITTFSSPYSSFFHKIIPALIRGNMFVFVPSPKVVICSRTMFNIFEQCVETFLGGITKRIFCVDTSLVDASDVIDCLEYDYILFTGKSETASLLKQQIGYHHGMFETGSSAMAYVDEAIDDIESLARQLVYAAFAQSGMRCIGLKNLFIQERISKPLIRQIVYFAERIPVGNPLDPDVVVGPIYDATTLSTLLDDILKLKESGYQIVTGGYAQNNNLLLPTILLDLSDGVLSTKEMYGPVLCIHVVNNFESIKCDYYQRSSLNTAFFSKNLNLINRFVEYCDTCGTICINCGPDKRDDTLPFGGLFDENDGKEDLVTLLKALSIEQRVMFGNI